MEKAGDLNKGLHRLKYPEWVRWTVFCPLVSPWAYMGEFLPC
jgi:hypothetical protein